MFKHRSPCLFLLLCLIVNVNCKPSKDKLSSVANPEVVNNPLPEIVLRHQVAGVEDSDEELITDKTASTLKTEDSEASLPKKIQELVEKASTDNDKHYKKYPSPLSSSEENVSLVKGSVASKGFKIGSNDGSNSSDGEVNSGSSHSIEGHVNIDEDEGQADKTEDSKAKLTTNEMPNQGDQKKMSFSSYNSKSNDKPNPLSLHDQAERLVEGNLRDMEKCVPCTSISQPEDCEPCDSAEIELNGSGLSYSNMGNGNGDDSRVSEGEDDRMSSKDRKNLGATGSVDRSTLTSELISQTTNEKSSEETTLSTLLTPRPRKASLKLGKTTENADTTSKEATTTTESTKVKRNNNNDDNDKEKEDNKEDNEEKKEEENTTITSDSSKEPNKEENKDEKESNEDAKPDHQSEGILPTVDTEIKKVDGFPTKEQYIELADNTTEEFDRLAYGNMDDVFPEVERETDGITVRLGPSPFPETTEKAIIGMATIDAPVEKVYKLMVPWFPYRLQWDGELYEDMKVLKRIDNDTLLVHSVVKKKLILDPRDSVDVYRYQTFANKTTKIALQSTTNPDWPEIDGYTRTVQRLGGFTIEPNKDNPQTTDMKAITVLDLNLPVPGFLSSLAEKFKPGQIEEFFNRLKKAAADIVVQ
ncbi:unnamed protein product [Bursaphelenchus okinawaensis]|uniref:START domain-containing protein n=1 Tax=Bursaphelenchus okinawaensis TaxID=465554 RepID=A0A811LEI8_9BILA|nr:unnamed protein product [Bursaphelenchus okinawaensis]CAG9121570.1 unnamed protein product [Bursaphelenchus okinawaensis]